MERNTQRNGLVNLVVLVLVAGTGFGIARYAQLLSGQVATVFLVFGFLSAAVSSFQMWLEEREQLEKLDLDELQRKGAGTTLFSGENAETFPARHSREQFERFFVPGFTILLFLLQGAGAFFLWRWLSGPILTPASQPMLVLGVFGSSALVLFLVGKYAAGLVRLEGQRLLGPSASYVLLGAYLYFLVGIAVVVMWGVDLSWIDRAVARGFNILLMLLATETLLALLLEIYRPRVKGKLVRILYESRLVGLLSHPEGLITTAAQALDYQFGFKVSDTWFYRFMERAVGWLVLVQLTVLIASTAFVFVNPGEECLLERFGKPVEGRPILQPGFHLKFPWPVDRVHRFRTRELQTIDIGFHHEEKDEAEQTILWTVRHAQEEFLLMVATRETAPNAAGANAPDAKRLPPVSLLSASIPVQFQISNLTAWAYNYADAGKLLEDVSTREVVRYFVSADLQEIISKGREQASRELRDLIQGRANALDLGVKIISVGLPDIHPPTDVAAAYEHVVASRQRQAADILAAKAYRIQTNALASAGALRRRREAEGNRQRVEVTAKAEANRFSAQLPAFLAAPEVYTQRAYLQTLSEAGRSSRKIVVVPTNTQDVILIDLQEKIRPDITDITIQPAREK